MGLMDNLTGAASDLVDPVSGNVSDNPNTFPKTLKTGAFFDGTGNSVDLVPGEYRKVGRGFIVPAQEQYRWGARAAEYEANQGYIYFLLQDSTPSEIAASVRFQQRDAQERNIVTVFEEDSTVLSASKSDRQQQTPLPEQRQYPKVGRDSQLAITANPEANSTATQADSEFLLPVTVYPV